MSSIRIIESKEKTLECPETLYIDFNQPGNPTSYSVQIKTEPINMIMRLDICTSAKMVAYFRVVYADNKVSFKGKYELEKGKQQLRECFTNVKEVTLIINNELNPGLNGVLVVENITI